MITKLEADLNIIQSLVDEPNDVGGLTANEVKAKFDEAGNIIKNYMNDVLIPSIESDPNTQVGLVTIVNNLVLEKPTFLEIIKKNNTNKFIAHRGLMNVFPENTLLAFEKSCQLGCFGFELDTTQASDGTWVVMHDDTIDRTTNGTGNLRSFTLAQLKTYVIDVGANVALYPNMRIPSLEEMLQMAQKYNTIPTIEIKYSVDLDWQSFVDLIVKYGMEDRCVVICFQRDALIQVRNRNLKIPIMLNENISSDSIAWLSNLGNGIVSTPYEYITASLVNEAHQNGVTVCAYTIDDFTTKNSMLSVGVDLMTTNKLI